MAESLYGWSDAESLYGWSGAESLYDWSDEVSFKDLQMCAGTLEQTGER